MGKSKQKERYFNGIRPTLFIASLLLVVPHLLLGEEDKATGAKVESQISESERISILEEELEKLKHNQAAKKYESAQGMAPSASSVYHTKEGVSLGGYGELVATDYKSPYRIDEADLRRLIIYTGYRFNDWILFNSEIEYEHSGFERHEDVVTAVDFINRQTTQDTVLGGGVEAEFAYLDFAPLDPFHIKVGLNLMPIGIINRMHEPTVFHSVNRPYTEKLIIPSTWRELGIISRGEVLDKRVVFNIGIVNGLNATHFNRDSWIGEDGSYRGSEASLHGLAGILNLELFPLAGVNLGASYYQGEAGQGQITKIKDTDRFILPAAPALGVFDAEATQAIYDVWNSRNNLAPITVHMSELHAQWAFQGVYLKGLLATGWMNERDTRAVNRFTGENVASVVEGGYLEIGYDIMKLFKRSEKLIVFVRNEYANTQKETARRYAGGREDMLDLFCSQSGGVCRTTDMMPSGNLSLGYVASEDTYKELYGVKGVPDRIDDRRIVTVGITYQPVENVSLKVDYEHHNSKTNYFKDGRFLNPYNNKIDQLNVAVGFTY